MIRTRVGYSGGTLEGPTYTRLGDHTETIQIDYDPERISYKELIDIFWDSHYPTQPSWSKQYMSIVFYHNDEQKQVALETKAREETRTGATIYTEIVPVGEFYPAEAYHQKYRLRGDRDLMKQFNSMYPDDVDFMNSTAAARINGYVAGYGFSATLQEELDSYGLTPKGKEKLQAISRRLAN